MNEAAPRIKSVIPNEVFHLNSVKMNEIKGRRLIATFCSVLFPINSEERPRRQLCLPGKQSLLSLEISEARGRSCVRRNPPAYSETFAGKTPNTAHPSEWTSGVSQSVYIQRDQNEVFTGRRSYQLC